MADTAGKGFRFVEPNEALKSGDEYNWTVGNKWIPVRETAIGVPLYAENFMHYRRPVEAKRHEKSAPKITNWQRIAKQMSAARTIGAARKIYTEAVKRGKK